MAYPYVKQTWTDGVSQTTAARMGVMEQGIYDAQVQASARVYHNTTQSLANAAFAALVFNTERWDVDGLGTSTIHDTAVNTSRLVARVAGKYMIGGCISFSSSAAGTRRAAAIAINGASVVVDHDVGVRADIELSVTTIWDLAVNDYAQLWGYQDSGGAMTLPANAPHAPEFWMVRVA